MKNLLDKELINELIELLNNNQDNIDLSIKNKILQLIDQYKDSEQSELSHEVTILISDIRGFSSISEKYAAHEIITILNTYFSKMNEIIQCHGGMIDKYMGDSILVVFGIPMAQKHDPINAIACAIEMQIAMDSINKENQKKGFPELFMGIGINTDVVSAGKLGSNIHNEFTVIGEGVNLTSRIESHTLRGQVLISESTYNKVKSFVKTGQINKVYVKGITEPVSLYDVTALEFNNKNLKVPKREVRNCIRLEIKENFDFQILKGKQVLPTKYSGTIKDISYDGLFAIVTNELTPLTNIKFSLSLSLLGGKTKDIYAKVVSVRPTDEGYGCGIEFTSLDSVCQESIKIYIDRIIQG